MLLKKTLNFENRTWACTSTTTVTFTDIEDVMQFVCVRKREVGFFGL